MRSRRAASAAAPQVPRTRGQEVELMLEAGQHRIGRESLIRAAASSMAAACPCRRALIAATAGAFALFHRERRTNGDGAFDEQANAAYWLNAARSRSRAAAGNCIRSRLESWLDRAGVGSPERVLLLARDAKRGAAGDDDLESGGGAQQVADHRGRRDDLLEIVEHEQHRPIPEPSASVSVTGRGEPASNETPTVAIRDETRAGRGSARAARRRRRP